MTDHKCPRRIEQGRMNEVQSDKWRNDDTCSYCGSYNPDLLMARLEAGTVELGPTDKSYKVYVENKGGDGFKQSYRSGCPASPCPDIVDVEGNIDVEKCTHWITQERNETKFYFQHFDEEQKHRFIELHNQGKLKIGMPGHFYRLPFFCRRED